MKTKQVVDKLIEDDQDSSRFSPNKYSNQKSSILPIGAVNLTTGNNAMFGTVWDGWEEGKGSNLLMQDEYTKKLIVIHTSGGVDGARSQYKIGSYLNLVHDQSGRRIGEDWSVLAVFPHDKEGFESLAHRSGKSSLPFYTFK